MSDRADEQATAALVRGLAMRDATGKGDLRPAVLTALLHGEEPTPLDEADSEADYLRELFQDAADKYGREGC